MGEVNICLKRAFNTLGVFIGIISTLLLAITLFGHGFFHQADESGDILPGIFMLYALGVSTLLLTICGLYGARTGKSWALIVFSVGMTVASLSLFAESVYGLQSRHEAELEVEAEHLAMMPLSEASAEDKAALYNMQINLECCGMVQGYQDWGSAIPVSCACTGNQAHTKCVEVSGNVTFVPDSSDRSGGGVSEDTLEEHGNNILVYEEPCLPTLLHAVRLGINTILAILFGLTLLWTVTVVVAVVVLNQLRRKTAVPPVMFTAAPKAGQYAELYNAPENV